MQRKIVTLQGKANVPLSKPLLDRHVLNIIHSGLVLIIPLKTIFLPIIGLVPHEQLKPGDLVGVNKDSYLILDTLPAEYDSRVKAMEVDERPTETYTDIGGLEKQIEELMEAIVWPMTQGERFKTIGIRPPKGVLMYGPPGTGKTLLARACAAQTQACYLKLAGPSLVQMFIGDGAKLVRDAFNLAKEKAPAIIFIDELDAIGTKRFDSDKSGDREVQRTMLELLNQLDGFSSDERIKVCILLYACKASLTRYHRLLLQPIESTSSIQPFSAQAVWIERSNFLFQLKKVVLRSSKYTREK